MGLAASAGRFSRPLDAPDRIYAARNYARSRMPERKMPPVEVLVLGDIIP